MNANVVHSSVVAPPAIRVGIVFDNIGIFSLGMSHKAALEIIRACGGQDITSNLSVVEPHGERPLSGLFWNLEQYNSVLEIAVEGEHVVEIGYWTAADFSESKSHRSDKRVLNIADVARGKATNSADFGFVMIEGAEKVRLIKFAS